MNKCSLTQWQLFLDQCGYEGKVLAILAQPSRPLEATHYDIKFDCYMHFYNDCWHDFHNEYWRTLTEEYKPENLICLKTLGECYERHHGSNT